MQVRDIYRIPCYGGWVLPYLKEIQLIYSKPCRQEVTIDSTFAAFPQYVDTQIRVIQISISISILICERVNVYTCIYFKYSDTNFSAVNTLNCMLSEASIFIRNCNSIHVYANQFLFLSHKTKQIMLKKDIRVTWPIIMSVVSDSISNKLSGVVL